MSAVDRVFTELRKQNRKALMPFITAGDPDLAFTAKLLRALDERGCHIIELGMPYSDPIADGPVIQASYTRALLHSVRLRAIWDMLKDVRKSKPLQAPLVTMASYAIIHRVGLERFVADAQAAGIAGAIVPDLLVEEAGEFSTICRRADFSLVQLVTPTTPRERAVRIAESTTGFLYYVSVTGITGERQALPPQLTENVGWLRERTTLPICIGFGISSADHVRLLAPVADGLIVGSAIVKRIAGAAEQPRDEVLRDVMSFVDELLVAIG
jgi:tryptophan synthase alpha chain